MLKDSEVRRCARCKYYLSHAVSRNDPNLTSFGECRASPPKHGHTHALFPVVEAEVDWCGEWAAVDYQTHMDATIENGQMHMEARVKAAKKAIAE